jgi:hypothetical protein
MQYVNIYANGIQKNSKFGKNTLLHSRHIGLYLRVLSHGLGPQSFWHGSAHQLHHTTFPHEEHKTI